MSISDDLRRLRELMDEDHLPPDSVIGISDDMAEALISEQRAIQATVCPPACVACEPNCVPFRLKCEFQPETWTYSVTGTAEIGTRKRLFAREYAEDHIKDRASRDAILDLERRRVEVALGVPVKIEYVGDWP